MSTVLVPVINGVLPRPGGGRSAGSFFETENRVKIENGMGFFVCPLVPASGTLYRVGVLAKVVDTRRQLVERPGQDRVPIQMVLLEGITHARWNTVQFSQGSLRVDGLESLDFRALRNDYPVVSGAGWVPQGGLY